jgi:hypothetical protein
MPHVTWLLFLPKVHTAIHMQTDTISLCVEANDERMDEKNRRTKLKTIEPFFNLRVAWVVIYSLVINQSKKVVDDGTLLLLSFGIGIE